MSLFRKKKKATQEIVRCSELSMSSLTWILFTTQQPCEEWKPHLCPRLNFFFFFFCKCEAAVWGRTERGCLHVWTGSQVLDLALIVHFLEMHPRLLFEVLSVWKVGLVARLFFKPPPPPPFCSSDRHKTFFYYCIIHKQSLVTFAAAQCLAI